MSSQNPTSSTSLDPKISSEKVNTTIPYVLSNEKEIFRGRWLGAKQVDFYHKRSNYSGVWQTAFRTTKPKSAPVNGVTIIPILKDSASGRMWFVLEKQFRIPVMSFTLEFPAGLVDPNENIEQSAMRELKEETGYIASKILRITKGRQPLDPGLTDDDINIVVVEIDALRPENLSPKQNLGDGEEIDVVLVPGDQILTYLDKCTADGLQVDAMVYSFAYGYNLSNGCEALNIGDNNIIEINGFVGPDVELTNGCVIGSLCSFKTKEILAPNSVVYGLNCQKRVNAEKPALQTSQLEYLRKALPNYHYLVPSKK